MEKTLILIDEKTSRHGSYAAVLPDGRVRAGEYESTARLFSTAEEAQATFRSMSGGHPHYAKIAEALEGYIEHKDEGR